MDKNQRLLGKQHNDDRVSLIEFPEKFPIKVFGLDNTVFSEFVRSVMRTHVDEGHQLSWESNQSSKGNYVAITVTILAQSQAQLDAIYIDLTASDLVKMAL